MLNKLNGNVYPNNYPNNLTYKYSGYNNDVLSDDDLTCTLLSNSIYSGLGLNSNKISS